MRSRIERYIFRQAAGAFTICLASLAAIVWLTQALREIDLLTLKGQTLGIFMALTALSLPSLVMVIAPVALFIAVIYVLNRLNSDSELVIMAASGASRRRLAKPFLALALIVSVLVGTVSVYLAPMAMKGFRELIAGIRADVITSIVRDGAFTEVADGLTFHVRQRGQDGAMRGLLVSDTRDEARDFTYLAENGSVVETPSGTFLVMQDGNIQRRDKPGGAVTVIAFEQYALDLSQFSPQDEVTFYKPKERSTLALLSPDASEPQFDELAPRIRGELHERLVEPLYPLAFALIALAFLGEARTTRQGRLAALTGAIVSVALLRLAGFATVNMSVRTAMAAPAVYALPLGAIALAAFVIVTERKPRLPDRLSEAVERLVDRLRGERPGEGRA